jgi:hypothetical protein
MTFDEWYARDDKGWMADEQYCEGIARQAWEAGRKAAILLADLAAALERGNTSPPATAPPTWTQGPPTSAGDFWCLFEEGGRAEFIAIEEFDADQGGVMFRTTRRATFIDDVTWHQPAIAPKPPI